MSTRLLSNVLVALLVASSVAQVAAQPPPPGVVDQVSPSDYALLEADLAQGMSLPDGINVESRTMALGHTDAQGNFVRQDSSAMTVSERIDVGGNGGNPGAVSLYVAILDSPERAIAFAREHYGNYGMNPEWMVNANEFGDPRIAADGGSVVGHGRVIIRHRNVVADFNWLGGLTTAVAIEQQPGQINTLKVARLWVNKVAGPPGADLSLHPDRMLVKHSSDYALREREPAADKQYMLAQIDNVSTDVAARGVKARLSVQMPGEDEYTPVQIVNLGTIAPGASVWPTFEWDLRGENVTRAGLLVDAWADGPRDMNPRDNQAGREVSIYYAHNGANAYRWREDSYGFNNYSVNDEDLSGMVKGLLATIVGEMYTAPQAGELLSRMFFPQTYMRFRDYLSHSLDTGVGGHCYGMSATAGLYFMDSSLRPGGGNTSALSRDAADANIKIYQRAQMVPIARAVINGSNWFERNWDSLACLNTVRQKLRDERRPVILSLAGKKQVQQQVTVNGQTQTQQVEKTWGHAVLAYKLVEQTGQHSVIYVYDPNLPPSRQWDKDSPMSSFHIDPDTGTWYPSSDMAAKYNSGDHTLTRIAARELTRDVSLAEANAIVPDLKQKLREMSDFLAKANSVMAVLHCPADAYFTDPQGRRTGYINGRQVNEIPGAEIRTAGEVEIYVLPANVPLTVSITGTGSGVAGFDIIRPEAGNPAITSFVDMPVRAGGALSGTLAPGGEIAAFAGGGVTHGPTFTGSLAGDRVTWQQPAAPTPAPTPAPAP
ncbi:MAG: hypothetical protein GX131_03120, partial [candidate division WS1 bacterium]|nr:hypothetical protein [candidate division WS1 bacterium]